jgi:hypothetical protein
LAFGSALAASVCASLPAASSEPASMEGQAQYKELQSISYEFGSLHARMRFRSRF